ncbi:DUF4148 domain-containing protein [Burkholderia sp. BCCIQ04A]|uniref:DUF4148 domain-containing protein n=1 Tax=Burkholderia anthinoferrum TaxID=3090833 RepID=A0ABU5WKF0_9BURK|nr:MULTISPECIES: DUF4148 domain-containing protein [Burkholderia]MEB2503632.1 DUF4148 domain-containing protein [Burkholderia anthinoferrum]MEB2535118.1 DUF4148 domain-containing protein [Burkholderia anthinoferrum]MEB2560898.1 DUF4148 domain-containing protein [Burkholderia anthinoferrum]MEB2579444.1 DUF4148 domain-containing protein [Burkholderia anthinoferrum]MDF3098881.1 DUF4148 domain-containing protein [Burkholderia semiarida]
MKTMKHAACAFVLIGAAFVAHAQAASTLTRAQVRQELVELQAAGYRTSLASSPDFPGNMQAIMQRAAQARGEGDVAGYGGAARARTESGKPALPHVVDRGTYAHH